MGLSKPDDRECVSKGKVVNYTTPSTVDICLDERMGLWECKIRNSIGLPEYQNTVHGVDSQGFALNIFILINIYFISGLFKNSI